MTDHLEDWQEERYQVRQNDFILPFYFRKQKAAFESYYQKKIEWNEPFVIEKRFSNFLNGTVKVSF